MGEPSAAVYGCQDDLGDSLDSVRLSAELGPNSGWIAIPVGAAPIMGALPMWRLWGGTYIHEHAESRSDGNGADN
jgi:hypothetical protein